MTLPEHTRGEDMRLHYQRPSAAHLSLGLSTAALFIALGGGAYAAANLTAGSVGTKQLRDGAVTPAKLTHALAAELSSRAATTAEGPAGPRGPVGATGATGAPGATGAQGPAGLSGPAGPQGDPGPAGPIGPIGLTGPQGLPAPLTWTTVEVPPESLAVGQTTTLQSTCGGVGGHAFGGGANADGPGLVIDESYPMTTTSQSVGWAVVATNTGSAPINVTGYVLCG